MSRTSCRSPQEAIEVACLVRSSSRLSLLGVEGYEGIIHSTGEEHLALCPALTVWSYVVSRPEPDLIVLSFGNRDASFDVDLPKPTVIRRDEAIRTVDDELEVFDLNDPHAYVQVGEGFDIAVGDIVGCGISHPFTTFDRWRAIPLVDEQLDVVGVIRTFFWPSHTRPRMPPYC